MPVEVNKPCNKFWSKAFFSMYVLRSDGIFSLGMLNKGGVQPCKDQKKSSSSLSFSTHALFVNAS